MQELKEIITQVKKIELTTKHLVNGLIAGNYHSIFKGQGIEFSEIREYNYGDDIRAIDWNVTARLNQPYVKEFIEERDVSIYIAFDFSASGNFGNHITKRKKGIELAATLMFSALKNNDAVGLFICTDTIEKYVPARKGRRHTLKILETLLHHKSISKKTNLETTLTSVTRLLKKKSILFIISDFFADNFTKPITILRNRHDVIAIRVTDIREKKLPNIGLIELEDEETGEQILIDTSDEIFRKNYTQLMSEHDAKLNKLFKKKKIDMIPIITDEPYETPLRKFFKIRKERVKS